MANTKKVPYTCPRCGYNTSRKGHMQQHFNNKKPCPDLNNIVLDDTIKNIVLTSRLYHPEKEKPINNIIHYNTINQLVVGMDVIDKVGKLAEYTQKPHIGFDERIRTMFDYEIDCLQDGRKTSIETVALQHDHLLSVVNKATNIINEDEEISDALDLNVIYDKATKTIKVYKDDRWISHPKSIGIPYLITDIQTNYLDDYEKFLIKKYKDNNLSCLTHAKVLELLSLYYRFLIAFSLSPFVSTKHNHDIISSYKNDNDYSLEEEFMNIYKKTENNMSQSEKLSIKKDVEDILIGNTKQNISELNKQVINLINMDEGFKRMIFQTKLNCVS